MLNPLSIQRAVELCPFVPWDTPAKGAARRVLVVGHGGAGNLGADLRERVLVDALIERLGDTVDVGVTTYGTGAPYARACRLPAHGAAALWRHVSRHHAVIVNEGCAFGARGVRQFAGALQLAHRQGKPGIALGVGLDQATATSRALVRAWVPGARVIARDDASQKEFEALEIPAQRGADPAWLAAVPRWVAGDRVVVCASSPQAWTEVPASRFEAWVSAIEQQLAPVLQKRGLGLIAACLAPADRPVAQRLAQSAAATVVDAVGDAPALFDAVAHARAVVSARYHGVLLSMLGGCPTVGVAADSRVASLVRECLDVREGEPAVGPAVIRVLDEPAAGLDPERVRHEQALANASLNWAIEECMR